MADSKETKKQEVTTAQDELTARRPRREVTILLPEVKAPRALQGFVDFIREQGVVGVAIGLTLGIASSALINSLVSNIFNPFIGIVTGGIALQNKTTCIKRINDVCATTLNYGKFISDLISFIILLITVYAVVKVLKLERLKKKDVPKK